MSYVASEMLHMGEEQMFRPAHAIFFSGCTARCRFCIAARYAFRADYGIPVTAQQLADRILLRQAEGARSVCFIGGDPVPHVPLILETLAILGERRRVPAVFNSNCYVTDVTLELLRGSIDIYLPDLKFGPGVCGEEIGGMPDYWRVVTGVIDRLLREGEEVVVRHLLMPGHFDCCTEPVLAWLAKRPTRARQSTRPVYAAGACAGRAGADCRRSGIESVRGPLRVNSDCIWLSEVQP